MGMSIDKTIEFFNGLECHTPQAKDARDVAVNTMRKYQLMQADYENRLKADMVAILEELQVEIDDEFKTNIDGSFPLDGGYENAYNNGLGMANQILKSKIDKLKEDSE